MRRGDAERRRGECSVPIYAMSQYIRDTAMRLYTRRLIMRQVTIVFVIVITMNGWARHPYPSLFVYASVIPIVLPMFMSLIVCYRSL